MQRRLSVQVLMVDYIECMGWHRFVSSYRLKLFGISVEYLNQLASLALLRVVPPQSFQAPQLVPGSLLGCVVRHYRHWQ